MKKEAIFLKFIRILVSVSFLFSLIEIAPKTASAQPLSVTSFSPLRADKFDFSIPQRMGWVMESWQAPQPKSKTVYLIQDSHANYEVEWRIARIIDAIAKRDQTQTPLFIGLEGGFGPVDDSSLKNIPDPKIRKDVSDFFMKNADLTGPEFYAVNSDLNPILYGIETPLFYLKNKKLFLEALKASPDILKGLDNLIEKANADDFGLNPLALEWIRLNDQYARNKISQFDYCQKLTELGALPLESEQNFHKTLQFLKMREKIDFKSVGGEERRLVDTLSEKMVKDDLAHLIELTMLYRKGDLSFNEYLMRLKDDAEEWKISLENFPNLNKAIHSYEFRIQIDKTHLAEEISKVEERFKEKLTPPTPNSPGPSLKKRGGIILRGEDATNASSSHPPLNLRGARGVNFSVAEMLYAFKRMVELRGSQDDLEKVEKVIQVLGWGTVSKIIGEDVHSIEENFPLYQNYYHCVKSRDSELIRNFLSHFLEGSISSAVLMVGGYHTSGIIHALRDQKISYYVISPVIPRDSVEKSYRLYLKKMEDPEHALTSADLEAISKMLALSIPGAYVSVDKDRVKEVKQAFSARVALAGAVSAMMQVEDPSKLDSRWKAWLDQQKASGLQIIPEMVRDGETAYAFAVHQGRPVIFRLTHVGENLNTLPTPIPSLAKGVMGDHYVQVLDGLSFEDFLKSTSSLQNALRMNPKVSEFLFTQILGLTPSENMGVNYGYKLLNYVAQGGPLYKQDFLGIDPNMETLWPSFLAQLANKGWVDDQGRLAQAFKDLKDEDSLNLEEPLKAKEKEIRGILKQYQNGKKALRDEQENIIVISDFYDAGGNLLFRLKGDASKGEKVLGYKNNEEGSVVFTVSTDQQSAGVRAYPASQNIVGIEQLIDRSLGIAVLQEHGQSKFVRLNDDGRPFQDEVVATFDGVVTAIIDVRDIPSLDLKFGKKQIIFRDGQNQQSQVVGQFELSKEQKLKNKNALITRVRESLERMNYPNVTVEALTQYLSRLDPSILQDATVQAAANAARARLAVLEKAAAQTAQPQAQPEGVPPQAIPTPVAPVEPQVLSGALTGAALTPVAVLPEETSLATPELEVGEEREIALNQEDARKYLEGQKNQVEVLKLTSRGLKQLMSFKKEEVLIGIDEGIIEIYRMLFKEDDGNVGETHEVRFVSGKGATALKEAVQYSKTVSPMTWDTFSGFVGEKEEYEPLLKSLFLTREQIENPSQEVVQTFIGDLYDKIRSRVLLLQHGKKEEGMKIWSNKIEAILRLWESKGLIEAVRVEPKNVQRRDIVFEDAFLSRLAMVIDFQESKQSLRFAVPVGLGETLGQKKSKILVYRVKNVASEIQSAQPVLPVGPQPISLSPGGALKHLIHNDVSLPSAKEDQMVAFANAPGETPGRVRVEEVREGQYVKGLRYRLTLYDEKNAHLDQDLRDTFNSLGGAYQCERDGVQYIFLSQNSIDQGNARQHEELESFVRRYLPQAPVVVEFTQGSNQSRESFDPDRAAHVLTWMLQIILNGDWTDISKVPFLKAEIDALAEMDRENGSAKNLEAIVYDRRLAQHALGKMFLEFLLTRLGKNLSELGYSDIQKLIDSRINEFEKSVKKYASQKIMEVMQVIQLQKLAQAPGVTLTQPPQKTLLAVALPLQNNETRVLIPQPMEGRSILFGESGAEYVIKRQLGQGGLGTVWLATRKLKGEEKDVVLKLNELKKPELEAGFQREIANQSQFNSLGDNVRPVPFVYDHEKITMDGKDFYAIGMEWVRGETLKEFMHGYKLKAKAGALQAQDLKAILDCFKAVLRALASLHAKGILHLDLKPSNIFYDPRLKRAVIIDLGSSRHLSPETGRVHLEPKENLSLTPTWSAPEMVLQKDLSERTDLFLCGTLLFTMLFGENPFRLTQKQNDDLKLIQGAIKRQRQVYVQMLRNVRETDPLAQLNSAQIVRPFIPLLRNLLEKDSGKRPLSVQNVLTALEGISIEPAQIVPLVQRPFYALPRLSPFAPVGFALDGIGERGSEMGLNQGILPMAASRVPGSPSALSGYREVRGSYIPSEVAHPNGQKVKVKVYEASDDKFLEGQRARNQGTDVCTIFIRRGLSEEEKEAIVRHEIPEWYVIQIINSSPELRASLLNILSSRVDAYSRIYPLSSPEAIQEQLIYDAAHIIVSAHESSLSGDQLLRFHRDNIESMDVEMLGDILAETTSAREKLQYKVIEAFNGSLAEHSNLARKELGVEPIDLDAVREYEREIFIPAVHARMNILERSPGGSRRYLTTDNAVELTAAQESQLVEIARENTKSVIQSMTFGGEVITSQIVNYSLDDKAGQILKNVGDAYHVSSTRADSSPIVYTFVLREAPDQAIAIEHELLESFLKKKFKGKTFPQGWNLQRVVHFFAWQLQILRHPEWTNISQVSFLRDQLEVMGPDALSDMLVDRSAQHEFFQDLVNDYLPDLNLSLQSFDISLDAQASMDRIGKFEESVREDASKRFFTAGSPRVLEGILGFFLGTRNALHQDEALIAFDLSNLIDNNGNVRPEAESFVSVLNKVGAQMKEKKNLMKIMVMDHENMGGLSAASLSNIPGVESLRALEREGIIVGRSPPKGTEDIGDYILEEAVGVGLRNLKLESIQVIVHESHRNIYLKLLNQLIFGEEAMDVRLDQETFKTLQALNPTLASRFNSYGSVHLGRKELDPDQHRKMLDEIYELAGTRT
ncbi:MAG: serine/threonine protein kinase [Chlamydiae bacterium]|nr:serine/threonine protein kinase [Chlamydiota bacterium]